MRKRSPPPPSRKNTKAGNVRKRDKLGRFLPKVSPKPKRKKSGPPRDKRGRFLPRGSTQAVLPKLPAYKRDKNGKLRDLKGRFVKVTVKEIGHHDGRKGDAIRYRVRNVTYQEAIDLYEFDVFELPEWIQYLPGAP